MGPWDKGGGAEAFGGQVPRASQSVCRLERCNITTCHRLNHGPPKDRSRSLPAGRVSVTLFGKEGLYRCNYIKDLEMRLPWIIQWPETQWQMSLWEAHRREAQRRRSCEGRSKTRVTEPPAKDHQEPEAGRNGEGSPLALPKGVRPWCQGCAVLRPPVGGNVDTFPTAPLPHPPPDLLLLSGFTGSPRPPPAQKSQTTPHRAPKGQRAEGCMCTSAEG